MKTRRRLASVTTATFAVSFLLPAYGADRGYACFLFCWRALVSFPPALGDLGAWLYYGGFAISNILLAGFLEHFRFK
jgi:hypothetical protein